MTDNVIVWASIPVTDLPRAMKFYEHVTGRSVFAFPGMEDKVAAISGPEGEMVVSADLSIGTPSMEGPTPYLGSRGDIRAMTARVVEAGGTVLQEPQFMGDMVGWVAFFVDSEGNRIGIQEPGNA
jgi:predicted enzyme related to lactoylglutathione lyase